MIAVPIRYRRSLRALFIQKLQHAIPSIVVLGDGLEHLQHGGESVDLYLGFAEVLVSVLVIGSVVRGFRQLRQHTAKATADHHHHHSVDWIDMAIGAMLGVEAYATYHATGHIPRPTILLGVSMASIGVLHPRLAAWGDRRRQLRVTADGISVPRKPFFRVTRKWADVAAIDVGDRYAIIRATNGAEHRIDLDEVFHPTAIREALMQARTFLDASRHASRASIESSAANS